MAVEAREKVGYPAARPQKRRAYDILPRRKYIHSAENNENIRVAIFVNNCDFEALRKD